MKDLNAQEPMGQPLKKIDRQSRKQEEWQVSRDNPKYEVNSKGQWRTRDWQPPTAPWPFVVSKPGPIGLTEQSIRAVIGQLPYEASLMRLEREPRLMARAIQMLESRPNPWSVQWLLDLCSEIPQP